MYEPWEVDRRAAMNERIGAEPRAMLALFEIRLPHFEPRVHMLLAFLPFG